MKKTSFTVALIVAMLLATPSARAQWVVFDPSNYSQNILTAARTLEQINNQIRQLQNQTQSLSNQARHLAGLDFSALAELRAALAGTNRLIQEAQGLSFNVARMESEFARLYPDAYAASVSNDRMALDARERWQNSLEALRTATRMQAQAAQTFAMDESALADLVNRSQSAVGQLQATQATNQLLALQARQSIQAQQLRITQDRAVALEQARTVAAQERAREMRRRFYGDGTSYTPQPIDFYSR